MKKIISILLMVLLIFISGCSKEEDQQSKDAASTPEEVEKIKVYASIYPMYDFTKAIGGDKIDLEMMVPPGAEPHHWEPTAKLMASMEKADVFIYNGANMETWADRVIGSLDNKEIIIVNTSQEVDLLELKNHKDNEEHSHEEDHDHSHEEDHDEEDEHNHDHGKYDPHIWVDPIRAIKQCESIKNALIEADKGNKEFYEENFNEFRDKLIELDNKYKEELKDISINKIVVAHAAFGYLTDRYGLEQISVSGLTPQEEPSAAKMAEISEIVKEHGIKYIFYESLTSPKLSEVLAQETGAKVAVLNPIGGLTQEEIDSGKNYISTMEENLESLKKALHN